MTAPELRAHATLARAKIAAIWGSRHGRPEARHVVHYWVRVIRLTERKKS